MSFCICNFWVFEDSVFIRSSDNLWNCQQILKKTSVAVSLLDCHAWNGIIAKSTQLALRTNTELPLIWFGSIIDVDCWVVYIMKDINLNWFHWQWGCSGHMNKEWSSILKYENNGFESCQKYLNLKEINHSTVKKNWTHNTKSVSNTLWTITTYSWKSLFM